MLKCVNILILILIGAFCFMIFAGNTVFPFPVKALSFIGWLLTVCGICLLSGDL